MNPSWMSMATFLGLGTYAVVAEMLRKSTKSLFTVSLFPPRFRRGRLELSGSLVDEYRGLKAASAQMFGAIHAALHDAAHPEEAARRQKLEDEEAEKKRRAIYDARIAAEVAHIADEVMKRIQAAKPTKKPTTSKRSTGDTDDVSRGAIPRTTKGHA